MQTDAPRSDAEIFGVEGGENYFLPLSIHRSRLLIGLLASSRFAPVAQMEYAETFLTKPPAGILFTRYETMEYLWLGEAA